MYTVDLDEDAWRKFQRTAPASVVRAAEQALSNFLTQHPEDRNAAAGRLKRLQGRMSGLLQYDLPSYYRLIYRVDRANQRVIVEYVGKHPNW